MKNTILLSALIILLTGCPSLIPPKPISDKARLFNNDYESLFNKYPEFESEYFHLNGSQHKSHIANEKIITNPPLNPSKKIYYVVGFIKKKQGETYIAEIRHGNTLYSFAFTDKIETARGKENIKNLRLNEGISLVGRLVEISTYRTVIGAEVQVPSFEALHIEPCKPTQRGHSYCAM